MRICEEIYTSGDKEERSMLAHDWYFFMQKILPNIPWMPIPNVGENIVSLVKDFELTGLILTGGNDIGQSPLRDITEKNLLAWAQDMRIPVLGICRGAQMLNAFCGGRLSFLEDTHKAVFHTVMIDSKETLVNSYHTYGIFENDLADAYMQKALAVDSSVEAFVHKDLPWLGLMWHPERKKNIQPWDKVQIQKLFGVVS